MSKLTNSGIDGIGVVPLGTHCCNIFDTKEQLLDTLIPYFIEGLNNNELCIWISSDLIDRAYAQTVFSERIPGFDAFVKDYRIEIWHYQDWYLENGVFSKERVMNKWAGKCQEVDIKKFNGLRVAADNSWTTGPYWDQWVSYEAEVGKTIAQYPMLALCNYHLASQKPDQLIDMMLTHQAAVLHKDSRVKVVADSPHGRLVRNLEEKISALEQLNKSYLSRMRS
ncbi:MAG: MEDS domain-containing protein [Candidatus Omnitrophota bacterium]